MISQQFPIKDSSYTGEIRRQAISLAMECGLSELEQGQVAIVINELCSNVLKHAGSGEIFLTQYPDKLEILCVDKGPGMANVNECLKDGYSTHGTPGTGLGAIQRLSHEFDLYTSLNKGAVIYSVFKNQNASHSDENEFDISALSVNYPGEEVCGDGWSAFSPGEKRAKILVSDGLGHGLLAHEASRAAISAFKTGNDRSTIMDITAIHNALKSTRGAAIAIADIQTEKLKIDYAGLGNISATLISRESVKKLISYNGTAGVQLRPVQPMSYPLEKDWVLIMHSDGLGTQWSLNDYPGLQLKHPALIAAVLYRDFTRGNDDVSVIVARQKV